MLLKVIGDEKDKSFFARTRLALRQAALDGKITIRGNKSATEMGGSSWSEIQTDIPREYWETADIGVLTTDKESDTDTHTFPHQFTNGRFGGLIFLYTKLRVDRSQIVNQWPVK